MEAFVCVAQTNEYFAYCENDLGIPIPVPMKYSTIQMSGTAIKDAQLKAWFESKPYSYVEHKTGSTLPPDVTTWHPVDPDDYKVGDAVFYQLECTERVEHFGVLQGGGAGSNSMVVWSKFGKGMAEFNETQMEQLRGVLAPLQTNLTQQVQTLTQQVQTLTQQVQTLTQQGQTLTQTLTQQVQTLTQQGQTLTQQGQTLTQTLTQQGQTLTSLDKAVGKLIEQTRRLVLCALKKP
eukprot:gene9341-16466_t